MADTQSLFITPVQLRTKEIVDAKLKAKYREGELMLTLIVNTNTSTHDEIIAISKQFREEKSRTSFVKAYYLYNFLIHEAGLGEAILVSDIQTALQCSKDSRKYYEALLGFNRTLTVRKKEHIASVKINLNAQKYGESSSFIPYSYCFHPGLVSPKSTRGVNPFIKKASYSYVLSMNLYTLLYERGYVLRPSQRLSIIRSPLLSRDSALKTLSINKVSHPKNDVYYPRYSGLEFPDMKLTEILGIRGCRSDVAKFVSWTNNKEDAAKYTSGRLYHPFHQFPKELRGLLTFKGSCLVEAMDIHASFYVMLAIIFRINPDVDRNELERYIDLVRGGRFYEDVMTFLQTPVREYVKTELQRYRNAMSRSACRMRVHGYFKERLPTICEALKSYDTYYSETKNKDVKWLQKDASRVETELISRVCMKLDELGYTPFSLHDAIYMSEAELADLTERGWNVDAMFWEEFDSLTDDRVRELINDVRSDRQADDETSEDNSPRDSDMASVNNAEE